LACIGCAGSFSTIRRRRLASPTSIPEIERHIKDAGFVPQRRNMMYQPVETPPTDKFGKPAQQKKAVTSEVSA